VDDYHDVARSTAMMLEEAGFEAKACRSGPEALSVAELFHPDVCLIDLTMPEMDGVELATRLQEASGGHPVRCIALTGSWDITSQHKTHNAGFEQHIVKPADPEQLIAAVRGSEAPAQAAPG
jgi:CheY-like chemotaxis protein